MLLLLCDIISLKTNYGNRILYTGCCSDVFTSLYGEIFVAGV